MLFQTCISWTQKKIFWRMWVTKQLLVAIGFHSIFSILWKWMATSNCCIPTFFRIFYFVFNRRIKLIKFWNTRVSKWWQNIHFWVNYNFYIDTFLSHYKKFIMYLLHNRHSNYTFISTFESNIAVQALFWFKLIILYIFMRLAPFL